MKQFIINYFWPKTSLSYFSVYLNFWFDVNVKKSVKETIFLKLFICLCIFQIVKYVYLHIASPSKIIRIILYDGYYLLLPKDGLSLMTASAVVMIATLFYFCYFVNVNGMAKVNGDFYGILFTYKWDSFIWSKHHNIHVCEYIGQCAVKPLIVGPIFSAGLYFSLLYMHIFMISFVVSNKQYFFFTYINYLKLLIFIVNGILASFVLVGLKHIWLLSFTMGLAMTQVALTRMEQIWKYLTGHFKLNNHYITVLHSIIVTNFFYINTGNWVYGNIFLIFFVVDVPINLRVVLWIVFDKHLKNFEILLLCSFACIQMIGLFGCHYMMALYSKRIHQPFKLLYHHLVHDKQADFTLKNKLKFAKLIYTLCTTKQYGVTYGTFGLVTMNSFSKFIIVYAKFLLITYKMHKKFENLH